jgi:hypothetical protein
MTTTTGEASGYTLMIVDATGRVLYVSATLPGGR